MSEQFVLHVRKVHPLPIFRIAWTSGYFSVISLEVGSISSVSQQKGWVASMIILAEV